MFSSAKKVGALGTAIVAVGMTGIALASWSSAGNGSGTASSTTSADSVIATGTHASDLYPGATKSMTVTISNPNDYPVVVTSISSGSSDVVNTNCAAASVTSDARALDANGLVQSDNSTKKIDPHGSGTYTLVTHMIANPDNACKSQDFLMTLTATVESAA